MSESVLHYHGLCMTLTTRDRRILSCAGPKYRSDRKLQSNQQAINIYRGCTITEWIHVDGVRDRYLQFRLAMATFCTARMYCCTSASICSSQVGRSARARYQSLYRAASMAPRWSKARWVRIPWVWQQMATRLWRTPSFRGSPC